MGGMVVVVIEVDIIVTVAVAVVVMLDTFQTSEYFVRFIHREVAVC